MNTCNLLHDNLFAYTEDQLPVATKELLDNHIAGCGQCAHVLSEFKSVMILMDKQKNVEIRPFAETRILQGIESKLEARQTIKASFFEKILQPAIISFAVVAAILIGLFIGYKGVTSRQNLDQQMTESVRTDLNIPDMVYEESFTFTE